MLDAILTDGHSAAVYNQDKSVGYYQVSSSSTTIPLTSDADKVGPQ